MAFPSKRPSPGGDRRNGTGKGRGFATEGYILRVPVCGDVLIGVRFLRYSQRLEGLLDRVIARCR